MTEQMVAPPDATGRRAPVSKAILLLLTLFLGGIGAHKVYLGKHVQAALYALFFWTLIPTLVALLEFVVYAFTGPDRLREKYSAERSVVIVILYVIGVFAAYATLLYMTIASFKDYETRAMVGEGVALSNELKRAIAESFTDKGPADMTCTAKKCPFDSIQHGPTSFVARIVSDKTGRITVEYSALVVAAPHNVLAIVPQIDGKDVDLSDSRSTGKNVTWKCGHEGITTLERKHLPAWCR